MTGAADKRGPGAPAQARPGRSVAASESAEANSIPLLRRRAGDFAATHGAGPELIEKVELAVSEAVTNAVKYAYPRDRAQGRVELTATASDRWIEVGVADRGGGFRPGQSDGLGIGLTLVAEMCDDLQIAQSPQGTTVTMRFALPAPD